MGGELFVDVAGIDQLHNQLRRASDDAANTLEYVQRHCDLSPVQQGLFVQALTTHEVAYLGMTTALSRLRSLADNTATQVNSAQVAYARTDLDAAADLDRSYPGATDANVLTADLTQERLQLPAGHASFTDTVCAATLLATPSDPAAEFWSFNPIVDLISPFAYLRQAAIWVFKHDPFELWTEWFAGDWDSYIIAGVAMSHAGATAGAIGDNLAAGAVATPVVWRGNAAENFQDYDLRLANAARSVDELGAAFNKLYQQSAECAKNFYDVISGFLTKMFDALLMVSIGLAGGTAMIATLAGSVIGYSVALSYGIYAIQLYQQISNAYTNAENLMKAIAGSAAALKDSSDLTTMREIQPYRHPGS
ncbi:hypothetical protein AB0F72_35070 [Actinoplanes sp. NPDC023936]|uniref:hypothetical protein n=1 Tax=Actinoplanes sp. NPDC023936 TaxID=3154910 RepID=UPI0033D9E308